MWLAIIDDDLEQNLEREPATLARNLLQEMTVPAAKLTNFSYRSANVKRICPTFMDSGRPVHPTTGIGAGEQGLCRSQSKT
jgi:hypothetical protein